MADSKLSPPRKSGKLGPSRTSGAVTKSPARTKARPLPLKLFGLFREYPDGSGIHAETLARTPELARDIFKKEMALKRTDTVHQLYRYHIHDGMSAGDIRPTRKLILAQRDG